VFKSGNPRFASGRALLTGQIVCGVLGGVVAIATSSTTVHAAASYQRFTSHICPYTIDYPTGWKVKTSRKPRVDQFLDARSPTASVNVICPPVAPGMTTRLATSAIRTSFQRQGFRLSKSRIIGGASIITGHAARVSSNGRIFPALLDATVSVHGNRVWVISLVADARSFGRDFPRYVQMVTSFSGK
jgi:hypothetical protein